MRLIETETGRITATISESIGNAAPVSLLSERISKTLLKKLKALYPLQGKIMEVSQTGVVLNMGRSVGVVVGQNFRVHDSKSILEVVTTEPDRCLARILKGTNVKAGYRVSLQ